MSVLGVSWSRALSLVCEVALRARDHYASSTLISGKGGAGPSSLPTMPEGPTEYVNSKMDVKSTWIPTWHRMDHISYSLGPFQKPPLEGRPNTNRETMALRTSITVGLFYFIMHEDQHE